MEDLHNNRQLTCVLFPGVVKNEEKAINLLGGIRQISHVYSQSSKKRLGLSFQPHNPFVKKIYADEKPAAGVVIKLRVKKTRINNEVKREVISTTILGRVTTMYRFESFCDFQYLPLHREGDGPLQCILEKILLSGVDDISVMSQPAPSFIVPTAFTRSDKPMLYSYNDKRSCKVSKKSEDGELIHRKVRVVRKMLPRITFNLIDDLPAAPSDEVLKVKEASINGLEKEYEVIKKLFEERPIWSQNMIRYITKINPVTTKLMLPWFGLCWHNGPWRMMWVRYGYDPRKDPGARFYQTLDFRVRHQAGVHSMIKTVHASVSYKSAHRVKSEQSSSKGEQEDINEASVIFRPGMVPSQTQIFYQYCDIKIPEVEALVAQEPPPGFLCHQRRGWLPPNTDERCRDHIFKHVKQTLVSTLSSDLKFETGSSDSHSEDEEGLSSTDEPSASTSNT